MIFIVGLIMSTIRYLGLTRYAPPLNMSIDQLLFDRMPETGRDGTLRFFTFNTACISIGMNQKIDELPDVLSDSGLEIIKRPTGGGAVLHDGDLCYSVIMPESYLPAGGSLMESYRSITEGLRRGFGLLGIALEYGRDHAHRRDPLCFAGTLSYELSFNGRKIIGGAQRRAKGFLLQQGSVMPFHHVPHGQLIAALLEGLRSSLNLDCVPLPLQADELEQARRSAEKFMVRPRADR